MSLKSTARSVLQKVAGSLPRVPGLGRCLLTVDRLVREPSKNGTEELVAKPNGRCLLKVDGRVLEQKFAYYYGEWEREHLEAVLRHYHRGVFYDVGGSIGLYAVTIGLECRKAGRRLRTIEPLPANLLRLRANLELNTLDESTVTVHEVGLSDKPGSFQVALVADGVPGNAKVVASGGVTVNVTTLDALWAEHDREDVGFIKIDTEGFDALILQGGVNLLRTCRPNLLVEFNRERMKNLGIELQPAWNLLTKDLGYRCLQVDRNGIERELTEPGEQENLLFLNGRGPNPQ